MWDQEVSMPVTCGGCRCGAVRYTLAPDALSRTYASHCRDGQTWTGSAFSQQTFLPAASLSVTGTSQRVCGLNRGKFVVAEVVGPANRNPKQLWPVGPPLVEKRRKLFSREME